MKKEPTPLQELLTIEPTRDTSHDMNAGLCGCGWSGKLSECETAYESEGWEYPSYRVAICPKCANALEDYYWEGDEDK